MRSVFAGKTQETIEVNMLLSMSKLNGSSAALSVRQQTPQDCIEMMGQIERHFPSAKIDFKFIYTDALYLNKDESAAKAGKRVLFQMTRHQEGFKKIAGDRDVEFLSWNQSILDHNQGGVESALTAMHNRYAKDKEFANLVEGDTLAAKRGEIPDRNDVEFILQELVEIEMIRRNQDEPKDKVIIAYPGPPLESDLYLSDKKHPLGKAAPVGHQAFWADLSKPDGVVLHEFTLPQEEEKFSIRKYAVAASAAMGVFAAAVGGVAAWTQEEPDSGAKITEIDGGTIVLNVDERTVVFYDRSDLLKQVVIRDGKKVPGTNRADFDVALYDQKRIETYLSQNP
ncbi:MAG: hypothetical protein DI551_08680 [Micavibrio aeruginosavorus]|uniref:Uncharacterized protein n=1 Tax=Micavibrio aeruginosavorus TaxID=349221 RepID=A0A2W5MXW4_9BACT|nr:MAG: hypothetical protein DI551_08680 [Micavibrio aeruginosavorus]